MLTPATVPGPSPRRLPSDPFLRARDERLESLKAVVGKLAHDFNNFLVPQFGYLALVTEEIAAGSPASGYLKTMEGAARTTEGYIESVLLAVRPQRQYSPKELDLTAMLQETVARWKQTIPVSTEIQLIEHIESAKIQGDERHWRKVIEHLLSNARFAVATGGTVEISLQSVQLTPDEELRLGIEHDEVFRLRIRDSGFGMSEAAVQRAFEPFFTTRPQSRASGLGLTIVHTVAHFHGGQVELESREEEGTTITLWLPKAPPAARAIVNRILRDRPRKKKVLLLEGDPLIKEVLRSWLAGQDFEVHTAETTAESAKLLQRDPSSWSLVIAEATLSDPGTGFEGVPYVLLTGTNLSVEAKSSSQIVKKPVSLRALSEIIQNHSR